MPCDPEQRLRRFVCGFPTGGWSVAAERLGLRGVEVELNPAACETLRAAGFEVREGSVTSPKIQDHWSINTVPGLIASPPCQTFSAAGKGAGRADMDMILLALKRWAWNQDDFSDPRTALVLEPARWILERIAKGQPYEWIAMEQVPTCLPIWHAYAEMLDGLGYFTAVGVLSSEQFGVPQTRKRAILLAHRERPISLPTPTHSKYYPRDKARLDEGVLPWVSMATALGWTEDTEVVSNYGTGGDASNRGRRNAGEPAASVTSKIDRNVVRLRSNYSAGSSHTGTAAERGRAERPLEDPAFTVGGKGGDQWVLRSDNRPNSAVRALEEPAPTILGNGERGTHAAWVMNPAGAASQMVDGRTPDYPAGTITGKGTAAWAEDKTHVRRVSVIEAGILQSFAADHPWSGTKTECYQQVGNAIPVLLAEAVLRQVVEP